jgi:hypothetical protein
MRDLPPTRTLVAPKGSTSGHQGSRGHKPEAIAAQFGSAFSSVTAGTFFDPPTLAGNQTILSPVDPAREVYACTVPRARKGGDQCSRQSDHARPHLACTLAGCVGVERTTAVPNFPPTLPDVPQRLCNFYLHQFASCKVQNAKNARNLARFLEKCLIDRRTHVRLPSSACP